MGKELFDQPLKDKMGDSDRIALAVPGQEGADNMTKDKFFGSIFKKGSPTLVTGSQKVTFTGEAYDDANYELMVLSPVGYEITLKEADGFTIDMLEGGDIIYLAIRF